MNFETAVRYSEMMMAFAYFQQSLEFMHGLQPEKMLGFIRAILSVTLLLGFQPMLTEASLLVIAILLLHRFQGPYNGGSDCMSMLVLLCLFLSHAAPNRLLQELAISYLVFQLTYSYFQSGYTKLINPDWRSGEALRDVFAITAYPVSEQTREWAESRGLMWAMACSVIGFELIFPLALFNHTTLILALIMATFFHLSNAIFLGLNRFFWIWPSAYPLIFWFQDRIAIVPKLSYVSI